MGKGWGSAAADSRNGLFWKLFLSCPQAAWASSPRVCLTLTVIFFDSKAAAKAKTCQFCKANWRSHSDVQVVIIFLMLKLVCIEILLLGTKYGSCHPNLPAKWLMILIKNHTWGTKKQNWMCNPSSWYRFLIWPSVFRTFYRIERYQVHMITTTAWMKQFCKFYCMLYSIIDTSCPNRWFQKKWLAYENSYY